jgi:hypothetical protein
LKTNPGERLALFGRQRPDTRPVNRQGLVEHLAEQGEAGPIAQAPVSRGEDCRGIEVLLVMEQPAPPKHHQVRRSRALANLSDLRPLDRIDLMIGCNRGHRPSHDRDIRLVEDLNKVPNQNREDRFVPRVPEPVITANQNGGGSPHERKGA